MCEELTSKNFNEGEKLLMLPHVRFFFSFFLPPAFDAVVVSCQRQRSQS